MDKNMNELLKWSIENQTNGTGEEAQSTGGTPRTKLNEKALASLFGGPSEAELMVAAMQVIRDPAETLDNKLIAFDNFEQLIEQLDNANNMTNLALWTPLLETLADEAHDLRRMAAWCVGTAVQNNAPSQERLLAVGGVPKLVTLATAEAEETAVRRKAIYALSSAVRNYQPALDVAVDELAKQGRNHAKVDAENMDAVDEIMNGLKAELTKA